MKVTSTIVLKELKSIQDKEYALFQAKLTPTVDSSLFIGCRVPQVRELAKKLSKEDYLSYLDILPHKYYDENMLHGLLISEIKDYKECIKRCDEFLPYVDNWAVCDIMSPKCFKKHKEDLLKDIIKWSKSKHTYTIRFGIEMLMSHFLDEDFSKDLLEIPLKVKSKEYYVNMMLAWFYATALTKQWDSTYPLIKNKKLDILVHNKTIQKACESYRITDKQKETLIKLKIK